MTTRPQLAALIRASQPEYFRDLAVKVRDWPACFAAATDQGVLGSLRDGLTSLAILSSTDQADLERRCAVLRLKTRHAWQSLEAILRALHAAAIQTVVLKGPLLGRRLHGADALRPSCDHDLLISPADLPAAAAALAPLGYRLPQDGQETFYRTQHHHVHLIDRAGQLPMVELHFQLSSNFGVDLSGQQFLERSLPCQTPDGTPCRILEPEDEFFYLAIHAAGHHFARLGWLVDLQQLLACHPEIQLDRVADQARQARLLVPFLSALDRLHWLAGVALEPSLARQARLRRWLGSQLQRICELTQEGSWPGRLASLSYQAALCDRLPECLRLLRRRWSYQWA